MKIGFQTSWNGTDLTFDKYPSNWKYDVALGNQEAHPIASPSGEMQIKLVHGGPPSMNFPKLVQKDPSSDVATTYVPIYYIDTVLHRDFSMGAVWNTSTNTWILTSQTPGAKIQEQTYATSTAQSAIHTDWEMGIYLVRS